MSVTKASGLLQPKGLMKLPRATTGSCRHTTGFQQSRKKWDKILVTSHPLSWDSETLALNKTAAKKRFEAKPEIIKSGSSTSSTDPYWSVLIICELAQFISLYPAWHATAARAHGVWHAVSIKSLLSDYWVTIVNPLSIVNPWSNHIHPGSASSLFHLDACHAAPPWTVGRQSV